MTMGGLQVFKSLRTAIQSGYTVYDRTPGGFLVRTKIGDRWAFVSVVEERR